MTAEEIKALLGLEPHPVEGGWYRRTYTSQSHVELPRGVRAQGTAIYYLLEAGIFSTRCTCLPPTRSSTSTLAIRWRCFCFTPRRALRAFDPWTRFVGWPAGRKSLVPAGVWQGARLVDGGEVALLGCTVTPGFDFADYRSGSYAELAAKWPAEAERIRKLTRK